MKVTAMHPTRFRNTVAGSQVESASAAWFETENPFTGAVWAEIPRCTAMDVDAAVNAAHEAFENGAWASMTPTARGKLLYRLADLVERDAEKLAALEVRDNGKLYAEMLGQLRYAPEYYRYFGGLADKIEGAVLPCDKPDLFSYTRYEPLGVIACITPWNSPILLLTWKLAALLAAGNTAVIKPSEFTSASTLAFLDLFKEAGFPDGVVNSVTGFGNEIGQALVEHPHVAKVAFTGGEATGMAVYQSAAKGLKHVSLELGGKSPNIIFEDAKIDDAVKGAISGIFAASGQTCIAGSRLLVQRSIYKRVCDEITSFAASAQMGDPMAGETQVGPITPRPQRQKVLDYIGIAKDEGARLLLGGGTPGSPALADGWFVEPTIFGDVTNEMRIAREEVFGPVLSILPFEDDDDAVRIANDTVYGLAAGVWTRSMPRAIKMSERLRAGTVWINTYRAVSFMAPFGGYKRSGIGRENGQDAIHAFLQTKCVWMNLSDSVPNPFVMR
ncbi:MAG: aldehyde dehydrogenase [Pseudomonadota bacterium]